MNKTNRRLTGAGQTACAVLVACCVGAAPGSRSLATENEPPLPPAPVIQDTNSAELLRSFLQLQEQLHQLQLSIQENRKEADAAATVNALSVASRLETLEQTLAAERARDLLAVRNSNRMTLLVAGTFGLVGLLAMLLMAYQWRTVGRLAEISAGLPRRRLLGTGAALAALGGGDGPLIGISSAEQSNTRLVEALDRLEKRIHELEQTGHSPSNVLTPPFNHAQDAALVTGEPVAKPAESDDTAEGGRITLLLGKAQSLLNLDKTEEALACFDEVLAAEPAHTDALIKKATALERLRKLPEAIECYDRAIAADASLTIAYLYKGGLFNRMDRFGEALECYEQALRAQERTPSSSSSSSSS